MKIKVSIFLFLVLNLSGESPVWMLPPSDRPQPPEGPVVFNEVYRNYMVISWNPPLDDGGCAISNYIIEKRDTNRDLWMPVTSSCTRTSCRVSRSVLKYSQEKTI